MRARQVRLVRRPEGPASRDDFELVEVPVPALADGQVLVQNRFLSVDPYMRARMDPGPSYYAPWALHAPLDGDAVGVVVNSRHGELAPGQWVASDFGLRDRFVARASELRRLPDPPPGIDHSAYLGVLGATGLTAFIGVLDVLDPQPEETVFITTAAGAVGSVAGQICRVLGAHVIGSAGSDEKVRRVLDQYGFDSAFNYHNRPASSALPALAPDGIDGMFDSVGGDQLEAALDAMRKGGRVAKCGAITGYDTLARVPGPANLHHFFGKRLLMRGFLVSDHRDRRDEFERRMREWLTEGLIVAHETRISGIENTVDGFLGLFRGENVGKTVIALAEG